MPEIEGPFVPDVEGFAAEMKSLGIHMGIGSPPVCPTCGESWPCPTEIRNRT